MGGITIGMVMGDMGVENALCEVVREVSCVFNFAIFDLSFAISHWMSKSVLTMADWGGCWEETEWVCWFFVDGLRWVMTDSGNGSACCLIKFHKGWQNFSCLWVHCLRMEVSFEGVEVSCPMQSTKFTLAFQFTSILIKSQLQHVLAQDSLLDL